jgi:6-phosphogluconate dehydrogenase
MPGGDEAAYRTIAPLLLKMAADDGAGGKCVTYVGPRGAGHFVKMVHNGIEYALMQLIAEAYDLLKSEGGYTNEELVETFEAWNESGDLQSFLMEITAKVLRKKDESGALLVDRIKDVAEQKGTGTWTIEAAQKYGVPVPTISAAVEARTLSGEEEHRARFRSGILPTTLEQPYGKPEKLCSRVRIALELSVRAAYAQGFELLARAAEAEGWNLNVSEIARIWRGGCIIRSAMLAEIQKGEGSDERAAKASKQAILARFAGDRQLEWRRCIAIGTGRGIPLPAMCASLAYFDSFRRERLPQNLIAAQRDFFGAHGYERIDKPGTFHTHWT